MAATQKSSSERSRGADSESICPGCSNRFGKAKPAPCLLRHLLRTHVRAGYHAGNQVSVKGSQSLSPGLLSSAASATFTNSGGRHANANAVGNARPEKAAAQTQKEKIKVHSAAVLPLVLNIVFLQASRFVARSSSG